MGPKVHRRGALSKSYEVVGYCINHKQFAILAKKQCMCVHMDTQHTFQALPMPRSVRERSVEIILARSEIYPRDAVSKNVSLVISELCMYAQNAYFSTSLRRFSNQLCQVWPFGWFFVRLWGFHHCGELLVLVSETKN